MQLLPASSRVTLRVQDHEDEFNNLMAAVQIELRHARLQLSQLCRPDLGEKGAREGPGPIVRPGADSALGVCPRCAMPIEHLEFYSQTGKFKLTGIVRVDGDAVVNFAGDTKKSEPGFYCPVCGVLLTEDVMTARRILMEES